MHWLAETLRAHPEVALFATLALGQAIGRLHVGPVRFNAVIGVLVAGLLIGQVGIVVPPAIQTAFFALFLFAVGYATGPQFFGSLRSNGLGQAGLATLFAVTGLATALGVARAFGLDAGTAGGLLAGSLNSSAAVGTASDAIGALPEAERARLAGGVTVAFAVTYLVGMFTSMGVLSWLGPRLMRVDLAAECRRLEIEMGLDTRDASVLSAYRPISTRAYEVPPHWAGRTAGALEEAFAPDRVFVERVRRGADIVDGRPDLVLALGDHVALAGPTESFLAKGEGLRAAEVADPSLLDVPSIEIDAVLTHKALAGKTLGEIAASVGEAVSTRGVFVRRISRAGQELPRAPGTVLERGDVLTLTGSGAQVAIVARRLGFAEAPGVTSDLMTVAGAIALGALAGLVGVPVGGIRVGLSLAVGVLLAGLIVGWARSAAPLFGRLQPGGLWILNSLGLTGFLAVVGLNTGPTFVQGVRESGAILLVAGVAVTLVPHVVTILAGRYVFGVHPGVLLGTCAGANTSTVALAAVQDAAGGSKVPTLGYGVPYAVGNVLLALWGTVIVLVSG